MLDFTRATALALTTAVCLGGSPAAAQTAASIEGVWKVTNVVVTGANPLTIESPLASVYTFTRGYYSNVQETGRTARTAAPAAKDPANVTDAEKLARYAEWAPFGAQAGTYEVKGKTLIRHPIVTKSLSGLTPADQPAQIALNGKTLTITTSAPAGQPAREQRLTLTRLR
jgi:hypothetical protein